MYRCSGAIFQKVFDLAAVLNALRAAVPGGELSGRCEGGYGTSS